MAFPVFIQKMFHFKNCLSNSNVIFIVLIIWSHDAVNIRFAWDSAAQTARVAKRCKMFSANQLYDFKTLKNLFSCLYWSVFHVLYQLNRISTRNLSTIHIISCQNIVIFTLEINIKLVTKYIRFVIISSYLHFFIFREAVKRFSFAVAYNYCTHIWHKYFQTFLIKYKYRG